MQKYNILFNYLKKKVGPDPARIIIYDVYNNDLKKFLMRNSYKTCVECEKSSNVMKLCNYHNKLNEKRFSLNNHACLYLARQVTLIEAEPDFDHKKKIIQLTFNLYH